MKVDNEYRTSTIEELKEKADSLDCNFRVPKNNELFIDIDDEIGYQTFINQFHLLKAHYIETRIVYNEPSLSGLPNRHIIVEVPIKLDEIQRILIQACLGSDRIREFLNYVDHTRYDAEVATAFFEPKDGNPQIRYRRASKRDL